MKTFDFAYWVTSLAPIKDDDHPTDRFPLKAMTIVHGVQDGLVEATKRITKEQIDYPGLKNQKEVGIAKITITEL